MASVDDLRRSKMAHENQEFEDMVMTAAQKLRSEGRKLGRLEGRQEGRSEGQVSLLSELIAQKFGGAQSDFVDALTKLDTEGLRAIALRFDSAKSLDELFAKD